MLSRGICGSLVTIIILAHAQSIMGIRYGKMMNINRLSALLDLKINVYMYDSSTHTLYHRVIIKELCTFTGNGTKGGTKILIVA